jgi:putative CocE/NonD family hydrolase
VAPALGDRRGALSLDPPEKEAPPREFISNPADPLVNPYRSAGAHDYSALERRNDVLTYDSPTLDHATEVTGTIRARIYLSCDCRDTDLWVRLLDVAPDGTAFNLMSPGLDVLRASYRDLTKGRQLLEPGRVYELQLDNMMTSNVFAEGHRIRIQVSATFFPNFSRNLHTGEAEATSAVMQKATIRLYHDRDRPSQVILPLVIR